MNFEFAKPEVTYEGQTEPFKPFRMFVDPLPRGFGETLANPIRRILLTYLPGTAVIGYKINGVIQDMQEIPGASTDTLELKKNLGDVRFKIESETEEVYTVRLKIKRQGPVYAKDLLLPTGVEVMNPDQEILILNGDDEFEGEFFIQKGYGSKDYHEHVALEDPKIIKVNTNYSPVKKVGYEVQTARVGDEANYDRIVFTITTDGSVHPKEAVELSIHLMMSFLKLFLESSDIEDRTSLYKKQKEERNLLMDTPIELLKLSHRSYNALKKADIHFVRDLDGLDKKTIGAIQQLGKKSVDEIIDVLESKGINVPD